MEINVISGALYTQDGKKIADVKDSSIMLVDELYKQRTMEVAENIGKTHSITCQLAPYDMRMATVTFLILRPALVTGGRGCYMS